MTVSRKEILPGTNSSEQYILANVEVDEGQAKESPCVHEPFDKEPDLGMTSADYDLKKLLARIHAAA